VAYKDAPAPQGQVSIDDSIDGSRDVANDFDVGLCGESGGLVVVAGNARDAVPTVAASRNRAKRATGGEVARRGVQSVGRLRRERRDGS
jgi:hypothetical protein